MTIAHKYPDDFEDVIYQSLLSIPNPSNGISIADLSGMLKKKLDTEIDSEVLFGLIKRLCNEGMAEKIGNNLYKGIKFDPTDLPVF